MEEVATEIDSEKLVVSVAIQTLDVLSNDDSHVAYYFVDTNIIIAYDKKEIPSLNRYVDKLALLGKHFFVTERIANEYTVHGRTVPPPFTIFHDDDADKRADSSYQEVMEKFDVTSNKFGVDMRWVLECGHCLHSCEDIPIELLLKGGSAFALTLNAKLVHRFLRSKEHRAKLERIVDDNGLEHLADLRLLHTNGTFEDLSAFV